MGLAHEPKRNAQEYLAHWLGILRADAKALMVAAAEFVLNASCGAGEAQIKPRALAA